MVRCAEEGVTGVYNATAPQTPLTMAETLDGMRAVTDPAVRFTWVDAEFLAEHGVEGFTELPLWFPPTGLTVVVFHMNGDRANAAGLTVRPLSETALDSLLWWNAESSERKARLGAAISAEREVELLEAWHARNL